jgi:transposase-like protein
MVEKGNKKEGNCLMSQAWNGTKLISLLKGAKKERKKQLIMQFEQLLNIGAKDIRENKYTGSITCPHCKAADRPHRTVRNGRIKPGAERQRYLCQTCGASFNDHSNTIYHRSKLSDHIPVFLQTMLDGLSIRETAKVMGISPTTAHAWRKKVLALLERHEQQLLEPRNEIVEQSSRVIKPSGKGLSKKKIVTDTPQTLLFEKGRQNQVFVRLLDTSLKEGRRVAKANIQINGTDIDLCTGSPANRILYHCENVKQLDQEFAEMYQRMRGVAQPYLHRYAIWHCVRHRLKPMESKQKLLGFLTLCL